MIRSLVHDVDGLTWPKNDTKTLEFLRAEEDIPDWVMSFVRPRRIMVQAGGNCGLYVARYAEAFDQVFTFEPAAVPFHCLVRNADLHNVYPFRAALGSSAIGVSLRPTPGHCGATQVDGLGCIPMLTVDLLALQDVDCIHLDVEGGELDAIHGAKGTIKRCRPVVALEVNECARQHGWSFETVDSVLGAWDYRHAGNLHQDHVWLPVERKVVP